MKVALSFAAALVSVMLTTAAPLEMKLWPTQPPGEKGDLPPERDTTDEKSEQIAGKRLIRLGNVSEPTLTFYPATASKNKGATVLVAPGGGYHILAMDLEGTEVCEWLNDIGLNAVLLKYRVPARKDRLRHAAALEDAQRAISLVRQHATEWKIDPKKIGVLGFSAGGHLAAALSTSFDERVYGQIDGADDENIRPDFVVLVYPGYLTLKDQPSVLPPELKVSSKTPPTFIVQTQDDPVPVDGALHYYLALHKAKVPAELHIYPHGGHGYGLRKTGRNVLEWPRLVENWLRESEVIK